MIINDSGENGISEEIVTIADGVRKRVAEEMHNYYTFDTGRTNYAVRIMQLMNILSAIDVGTSVYMCIVLGFI